VTIFSLSELSDLFAEIGAELSVDDAADLVLRRLTDLAVRRVPGAEFAGITVGRAGMRFQTVAATDDIVFQTDAIQYALSTGPCVDAIVDNTRYNAPDLRSDARWPEFGKRAVEQTGIVSMLSLRLYFETDRGLIAGMNMYSRTPDSFNASSETVALLLATHGALAAARADAQEKARNLLIALENSREIGIAMGVIMATQKVTRDQAFDLLRIASQHTHRKLSELAGAVADTGVLPDVPTARPHRSMMADSDRAEAG
jgi:GAF domain-containing protein